MKNNLIIILISCVMLAAAFVFLNDQTGEFKEITATITDISYENSADNNEVDTVVYVSYTVNGKKYENIRLPSYDFTMKKGERISVEYNVDNPEKLRTDSSVVSVIILFVIAAAGLIFGTVKSVMLLMKKKQNS